MKEVNCINNVYPYSKTLSIFKIRFRLDVQTIYAKTTLSILQAIQGEEIQRESNTQINSFACVLRNIHFCQAYICSLNV